MLKIWTGADTSLIKDTFAGVLRSFRPNVPPHEFVEFEVGEFPDVEPGDVVLACGKKLVEALAADGKVPKNRTVPSLRERAIPYKGATLMVTYDPGMINREPDKKDVIEWDVRLAVRLMTTGGLEPQVGDYRWVNSYQPMIDWIEAQYAKTGKAVDVACDTETMGFYPWYPDKDIVSISFTAEPNRSDLLYLGPLKAPIAFDPNIPLFDQINWLLTSPKVKLRLANGKYDLIWIAEKWGIECTNFKFDTMLVGSLLDENRSNSLNLHAKLMTDMGGYDDAFNSKYDKGKMETIPPEDLLVYAGGDTDAAQQVADVQREELAEDEKLTRFYLKVLHPAARAFEKLERRGVLVDTDKMGELREELSTVIKAQENRALELLPNKMRIKYRERIDDQIAQGKNPMLPSILKEYFFSPAGLNLKPKERTGKTREPSMAKSHLRQFGDVPEAMAMVHCLTEMDQALKTRSTFVDGFLKHLRPDGRIHPTYFLAKGEFEGHDKDDVGTTTGRLSAKDPAFQIIPKKTSWAKKIRACYPAPPGMTMLNLDFSQGELRVVACVANEKTMLASYEQNLDLHAVTGAKLGGVDFEEFMTWKDSDDDALSAMFEKYRGNAKPANFGLLYGMGVEGFQAYAWATYGLRLTYEEAETIRNAFFELYPGLTNYHENQRNMVKLTQQVRSPLGRLRHLPTIKSWDREIRSQAERQAINSPIQSCLSDMMLWAIALIEDAYGDTIEQVGMVHDALVAYVPEQDAALWAGRAQEIMSSLPFHEVGWNPQLKFPADAEGGPNLAELKKLTTAA